MCIGPEEKSGQKNFAVQLDAVPLHPVSSLELFRLVCRFIFILPRRPLLRLFVSSVTLRYRHTFHRLSSLVTRYRSLGSSRIPFESQPR